MSPGGSDEEFLFKKGSDFVKNKQFDEALEIFDDIVGSNPSNEKAWVARGVVLNYQKKYQAAELAFNQALRVNPNNQIAINNRDMMRKHLDAVEPSASTVKKTPPPSSPEKPPDPSKAVKIIAGIILILFVISAISSVIGFVSGFGNKDAEFKKTTQDAFIELKPLMAEQSQAFQDFDLISIKSSSQTIIPVCTKYIDKFCILSKKAGAL